MDYIKHKPRYVFGIGDMSGVFISIKDYSS